MTRILILAALALAACGGPVEPSESTTAPTTGPAWGPGPLPYPTACSCEVHESTDGGRTYHEAAHVTPTMIGADLEIDVPLAAGSCRKVRLAGAMEPPQAGDTINTFGCDCRVSEETGGGRFEVVAEATSSPHRQAAVHVPTSGHCDLVLAARTK